MKSLKALHEGATQSLQDGHVKATVSCGLLGEWLHNPSISPHLPISQSQAPLLPTPRNKVTNLGTSCRQRLSLANIRQRSG